MKENLRCSSLRLFTFFLLLIAAFPAAGVVERACIEIIAQRDVEVIRTPGAMEHWPALIAAIDKNQYTYRFKISGSIDAPLASEHGALFYDRRQETVRYEDTFDEKGVGTSYRTVVFRGVNDEWLRWFVRSTRPSELDADGFADFCRTSQCSMESDTSRFQPCQSYLED